MPNIIDNTNFRYVKVDDKFIVSLSVKSLPETIFFLDIVKDFPIDLNYDASLYISKQDPIKVLNSITYNIGAVESELATINKNQRDIDILSKTQNDSAALRKKIQVENQEIYVFSLILTFYSYDFNSLAKIISSIRAKFYSKGINLEVTNFRHLEFFLSNLPLENNKELLSKMYITTNALANIFPFYNTSFIDEKGVILGYTKENKLCILDIFSNKYENSNICIFGSSGSGKSYFTKLFIIRNYFLNKRQIIFDIEGEYENLCKNLYGEQLFKDSYINILQITDKDIKEEDFLDKKITKVAEFMTSVAEDIDSNYLKDKLYKLYGDFNITNNIDSVIVYEDNNEMFLEYQIISKDKFPTLIDLIEYIDNPDQKEILIRLIDNELKFFSKETTIKLDSMLYVLNMSSLIKNTSVVCEIMDYILNNYINDTETIIYVDELWKYSKDEIVLEAIFNMYKTIRKRRGAIVTITQEISDFYEYKNGLYANTILNNSSFKFFFKANYSDLNNIKKYLSVDYDKLLSLKKTEALLLINRNNLQLKVRANDFERGIIDEDDTCTK